jgi:hypothetical protein
MACIYNISFIIVYIKRKTVSYAHEPIRVVHEILKLHRIHPQNFLPMLHH